MWANPLKEGELCKQGAIRKSWKTRWFVLQDGKLFYFKSKKVRQKFKKKKGHLLIKNF